MAFFKEKTQPAPAQQRPQPTPAAPAPMGYGIQQAIDLMHSLPLDLQTTDVVVQVIKRTLESAHIDVGVIIDDATRREEQLEARIRVLQDEVARAQREIETRNSETALLQADLEETSRVKERLALAEKLTG